MYAILDIETTGGKFNEEGITEIAIHKFDGHTVVDQFITLVNPERPIQEFVVKLTGITNKMVRTAPKFFEIAKRILEITDGCILIAHNTSFDYRILKTEFDRLGYAFKKDTLCTVALSKKLIPDMPSYSLGKLCKSLGIPMSDRHRANGDAIATVHLFKLLLTKDVDKEIIESSTQYIDKRNIQKKLNLLIKEAPTTQGVFYVQNENNKVIYIGFGNNMQKAVNTLFLKRSDTAQKIQEKVHNCTYEATGSELITQLKYHSELALLKPKYTSLKKQKGLKSPFAHPDMLLIEPGRTLDEHAIVLIENNQVFGYGFTTLAFQEHRLEILKSILTPVEDVAVANSLVKKILNSKTVQKIIRL